MAFLQKLEIKGIRSYNPRKFQTLSFDNSLTLIIGQNGTGKTTIIESLKYITTNTLPPNTKGGAFIYDNSLANDTEVRAEIKLSICDKYDRNILLQKVIQSSMKKSKVEQKTLEFNITIDNDKGNKSLGQSIQKADLSSILNLNNSLLENVIFCHQDDSIWCLSEPCIIKKKFDDIFSSTKYTKLLDNLKTTKKEVTQRMKQVQVELSYLIKQKDKKTQVEDKVKEITDELDNKCAHMASLEKNIKECNKILEDLTTEYNKVKIIESKMKEVEKYKFLQQTRMSEEECQNILESNNLAILEEEMHHLDTSIKNVENQIRNINLQKTAYDSKRKEIEAIEVDRNNIVNLCNEIGVDVQTSYDWLVNQNSSFQAKLKITSVDITHDNITEMFEGYFSRYEELLDKKLKGVERYKSEYDDINMQYNNNCKLIEDAKHFVSQCNNIDLTMESTGVIGVSSMKAIKGRIEKLEKEYENCVGINREMIINEEKKKRQNDILQLLQNKTRNSEESSLEQNKANLRLHKALLKNVIEKQNLVTVYASIIKEKQKHLDIAIYKHDFEKAYDEFLGLDSEICDRLFKLSIKSQKCYICAEDIKDFDKYKKRLQNISSVDGKDGYATHKNNVSLINDIDEKYRSIVHTTNQLSDHIRENVGYVINVNSIHTDHINTQQYTSIQYNEDNMTGLFTKTNEAVSKIQSSYDDLVNDLELVCMDLEEEIMQHKSNIALFTELTNIKVKDFPSMDIEDISRKLRKHKQIMKLMEMNEKKDLIEKLEKDNEIHKHKLSTLSLELKKMKSKNDNLRDVILKKKTEIEIKTTDFTNKKIRLHDLENRICSMDIRLKEMKKDLPVIDHDMYSRLMGDNLAGKERLFKLKLEYNNKKELVVDANIHVEHYKNTSKCRMYKQEIASFEKVLITKIGDKPNIIHKYLEMLEQKTNTLRRSCANLLEKKNMIFGEVKQLEKSRISFMSELNTEYEGVVNDYNKKYIEFKILEMSIRDIDKCIKVLDKTIIDYHYSKIEEINAFLREFWANCYKGNDIDAFKLKIIENGTKCYSYKLVIIKNGVELDMRNRSSAGQKMIGSILLRLALSHVFCCNFNVLTLDEPTTNLDKENVESLARTLINITQRSKQLQLVIITHDEDFLSIMGREGIDAYYRIYRNDEGDSIIKKEVF